MYSQSKKKEEEEETKYLYLFQCKLSYKNDTGSNHHGLLFTSV